MSVIPIYSISSVVLASAWAVVTMAAVAPGAEAEAWPDTTLTYRNFTDYREGVEAAVELWNQAPVPARFVPAASGRRADIRIFEVEEKDAGWTARAMLPPGGAVYLNRSKLGPPTGNIFEDDVIAHELGHTLGLRHSRLGCALMHPQAGLFARCKDGVPADRLACGPQRADVNAARHLYGRKPIRSQYRGTCPVEDALGSASAVTPKT